MNYEKLYFAFIEKYKNQVFEVGLSCIKRSMHPVLTGSESYKCSARLMK